VELPEHFLDRFGAVEIVLQSIAVAAFARFDGAFQAGGYPRPAVRRQRKRQIAIAEAAKSSAAWISRIRMVVPARARPVTKTGGPSSRAAAALPWRARSRSKLISSTASLPRAMRCSSGQAGRKPKRRRGSGQGDTCGKNGQAGGGIEQRVLRWNARDRADRQHGCDGQDDHQQEAAGRERFAHHPDRENARRAFLAQSETPLRAYAPSAGRLPQDRRNGAAASTGAPDAGGQKRGEQDQRGGITARIPAADRLRRRSRLAPRRADQPLDRIPHEGHDPEKMAPTTPSAVEMAPRPRPGPT
jgi:hypothetical protein